MAVNDGGGGGGGAAGPMGAGGKGNNGAAGLVGGLGGTADGGTVAQSATAGLSNQRWDASHGCGGGGGGSADSGAFAGGSYGGGGGGGSSVSAPSSFRNGKPGGNGLIILTYIPLLPSSAGFNMPMMGL